MRLPVKTNKLKNNFRLVKLIFAVGFACLLLSPISISAKSLRQYHESVRQARDLTYTILYPEDEDETPKSPAISESQMLKKIRQSVPANEKVEWQGASVETNNQWLVDGLDEFERAATNSPQRETILTGISERLDALDRKIEELENPPAQNRAKDEDAQKLAEILRRDEYQKPEKQEESIFQKIYRKIIDWLASFFPRPKSDAPASSGSGALSFVLQMLLYALVIGVIAFLLYKFAPFLAGRFHRKVKKEKTERVILGERLAAEETAENLFAEAENLASTGNLRGAIRKGYIALLCELADRKIIGLARSKTNRDYLRDVRAKNELYQNMNGLTANFERHWYGFETAEEKDWEEFRRDYRQAVDTIH